MKLLYRANKSYLLISRKEEQKVANAYWFFKVLKKTKPWVSSCFIRWISFIIKSLFSFGPLLSPKYQKSKKKHGFFSLVLFWKWNAVDVVLLFEQKITSELKNKEDDLGKNSSFCCHCSLLCLPNCHMSPTIFLADFSFL